MKKLSFFIFSLFLLASCSNNPKNTSDSSQKEHVTEQTQASNPETPKAKKCIYRLNEDLTNLKWTAYKTTAKIGVKGTFDNMVIKIAKDTLNSIKDAIADTKFILSPLSVNSGNKERDAKLTKYFFKSLGVISGMFKTAQDDGSGSMQMIWNGFDKEIPYSYKIDADTLLISSTINFAQWKADNNAKALNRVCKKLHTGKDGVSKLWPDVDVQVKVVFKKYCN